MNCTLSIVERHLFEYLEESEVGKIRLLGCMYIIKNKKMGRILLWVGGLYGIVVGLYSAFGPAGEYHGNSEHF
jgi:hypothetical protein